MINELPAIGKGFRPSYEQFVKHNKGLNVRDNRRKIKGVFKNKKTGAVIKGDNFDAIDINGDAEKAYKIAIEYYNHTRQSDSEAEREFVSAEWAEPAEEEK